jgi:tRNA(adenine34) deaminase
MIHQKVRSRLDRSPEYFMLEALKEARKAADKGEVPVGAVVVKDGRVVARGHNLTEQRQSALAHAEMAALSKASRRLRSWRLNGCDLFATMEPCTMCGGAVVLSRIRRLYYGAEDPKAGAVASTARVLENAKLNHRVEVTGGILKEECSRILTDFFRKIRRQGGPRASE